MKCLSSYYYTLGIIFFIIKSYATSQDNSPTTKESINYQLDHQNNDIKSKQEPKNNEDDFFFRNTELCNLINFIENESDISSTAQLNKSDRFLNEEVEIYLEEMLNASSQVTKCYNYDNLLAYISNTNDIIYDIIISMTKNEEKYVKMLAEFIRRVNLELEIIDKLLPEVEQLFEAKSEKEKLVVLNNIKDGITDLKNNIIILRGFFERYRVGRIKDFRKEYDLKIQLLKELQEHLKTIRNLLYPLSEEDVQKRSDIFLHGLITTVSEISNTISRNHEKDIKILKFDFNILEDVWIGVRKNVDRLISYKKSLFKN